MIEEVVNSILQAEDAAKEKIADAEKRASQIVALADIQAEEKQSEASLETKAHYKNVIADAEKIAEEQSAELLARLNEESDKEAENYRKNTQKAVKIILESL